MAEKPDVFMPLYIGDYLAGTSRLTTELHGAYMLLIMDYWMNGQLPDDDATLASITKMNVDDWKNKARPMLQAFFEVSSSNATSNAQACWKHKRIEEELAKATEKKAAAKEKAARAAAARWAKESQNSENTSSSNATSTTQAMLKECPSPSPSNNNINRKKRFNEPSVEEVRDYCAERSNQVDAAKFIDFYTSNGWMVGKNKMKDWKAAVRNWERNTKASHTEELVF
ncbi:hypothetical protein TDB9533_03568 [Thalassocella blandensis]|nr:hypothetical protein TDB9533_03568 [Thalassocella blandensis]